MIFASTVCVENLGRTIRGTSRIIIRSRALLCWARNSITSHLSPSHPAHLFFQPLALRRKHGYRVCQRTCQKYHLGFTYLYQIGRNRQGNENGQRKEQKRMVDLGCKRMWKSMLPCLYSQNLRSRPWPSS